MNKPHKSITHAERFYHIRGNNNEIIATVFFRQEESGNTFASVAVRSSLDSPNKRVGRQVARRKYFNGKRLPTEVMSYEAALDLYDFVVDSMSPRVSRMVAN